MPGPINPSMRKVLDDIAASQNQRAEATAAAPSEVPARGTGSSRYGTALDDQASAQWQRQEEHLLALRQEAAEQTRLLREILARLPERP
jgi:hypothetical protein